MATLIHQVMLQISTLVWHWTWSFLENTLRLSCVSIPGLWMWLLPGAQACWRLKCFFTVQILVSYQTSWVLVWFTMMIGKSLDASHGQCHSAVVERSIIRPTTLDLGHNQRCDLPVDDWKWDYKPFLSFKCSAGLHGVRWGAFYMIHCSTKPIQTLLLFRTRGWSSLSLGSRSHCFGNHSRCPAFLILYIVSEPFYGFSRASCFACCSQCC